jgi:AmpD protein
MPAPTVEPANFEIEPDGGWFRSVRRVPSPNCDDRPPGTEISLIVIHGISLPPGKYGGPYIDQLFTNTLDASGHPYFAGIAGLRVSSHLVVDRRGIVTQYVPVTRRAWHAGQSTHRGREACNDFSVGIEFEGCDDEAYCGIQYEVGAALVTAVMAACPTIGPDAVARHSDISPGRKTDPGPAFEWGRFRALVSAARKR